MQNRLSSTLGSRTSTGNKCYRGNSWCLFRPMLVTFSHRKQNAAKYSLSRKYRWARQSITLRVGSTRVVDSSCFWIIQINNHTAVLRHKVLNVFSELVVLVCKGLLFLYNLFQVIDFGLHSHYAFFIFCTHILQILEECVTDVRKLLTSYVGILSKPPCFRVEPLDFLSVSISLTYGCSFQFYVFSSQAVELSFLGRQFSFLFEQYISLLTQYLLNFLVLIFKLPLQFGFLNFQLLNFVLQFPDLGRLVVLSQFELAVFLPSQRQL